ncbi:MAG: hypothetical protein GX230_11200 [Lentisphaerae bacterium]|nr:hypothetical protein [Lentisphaerota bacterium]
MEIWVVVVSWLVAMLLQRFWLAPLGVVCYLAPQWVVGIVGALRFRPDMTVAVDPQQPSANTLAEAFRVASERAKVSGKSVGLAIAPLYDNKGKYVPLRLELTSRREVVCSVGTRKSVPFEVLDWLPRHRLPLMVDNTPLEVSFVVESDKRVATLLADTLPQHWLIRVYVVVSLILLVFSTPATLVAVVAGVMAVRRRRTAVNGEVIGYRCPGN